MFAIFLLLLCLMFFSFFVLGLNMYMYICMYMMLDENSGPAPLGSLPSGDFGDFHAQQKKNSRHTVTLSYTNDSQ